MVHWPRFLRVPMLVISVGVPGCTPAPARVPWPVMIAHRGGSGDAPENTIEAIRQAIAHRADAIWLTVQLSRDGIPVLYRPADLSALTDGVGKTAAFTAAELSLINAGWQFRRGDSYPYRDHPVGIPTLREALRVIPSDRPIILDMKALPAAPQTQAVARVLEEEQAWGRVTIYATDAAYQQSFAAYPQARLFESRDATRGRLLGVLLDQRCDNPPPAHAMVAFELHRSLTVVEHFTLGEGRSMVQATMWTPAAIACFRRHPDVKILAIAVDNADDDRLAACLGVDAILTDSPQRMAALRRLEPAGPRCERISHGR
ncbi:Glycerophosphoryl diester phosphodiesterase [Granulibacter bethesdensis]|uniref:Glycerophosphoryl diester phosphodiesterase n=1 Tax=Granulibacter bethesdensis TaxID=364410 RepID=A0AAC9K8I0_9PROT|nr:glycerophosphodiester phosphodiesterase family protein [Granulibacter bethesdensis]APH53337.1 Glycerophosphoryl diester phosphodiesterase [Granulibacter bethesdensis]APH60914.1 Glycerophosphoryl diester phosphodiesterase [Granulibacter bethesdensis]